MFLSRMIVSWTIPTPMLVVLTCEAEEVSIRVAGASITGTTLWAWFVKEKNTVFLVHSHLTKMWVGRPQLPPFMEIGFVFTNMATDWLL